MDFGLLNQDCLWIMDEVQLMDVGLATSAQLQAFRDERGQNAPPTGTWWMSATLQPTWLDRRDTRQMLSRLARSSIPETQRTGRLWDDVHKPCTLVDGASAPREFAKVVAREHLQSGKGAEGPTLVVLNTVERAVEVARALRGDASLRGTEVRLVHSRFRPAERASWREDFLNRVASGPGTDRVIVATQVVEAGVDVSSRVLVTDVAPWPSLVQRFGRAARWGGAATIVVVNTAPADDKAALPYTKDELDAATAALQNLNDVSPRALERFEDTLPAEALARLYPYDPACVVLRHEVGELFDTIADLSGADLDVSRFIRSGEERDLQIFWGDVPREGSPAVDLRPSRDALCNVPFLKARQWLCGKGPRLRTARSAWVWDWLDGTWRVAQAHDLFPGQTVLVDAQHGGYDWSPEASWGVGWDPTHTKPVNTVASTPAGDGERADSAQDDESLSATPFRTIATHGRETGAIAAHIANRVGSSLGALLDLAGKWHDIGKAHPAFQHSIRCDERPWRCDLAKAPAHAWSRKSLYRLADGSARPGFRHELASALALFAVLQRHAPDHAALQGPWKELLDRRQRSQGSSPSEASTPTPLEASIIALTAPEFDLLAYLVACHHGKVRVSLHATPSDQDSMAATGVVTIRGIRTGDELPAMRLGESLVLPRTTLDLSPASMGVSSRTGASWTERVLRLLEAHGPFHLAWLEALLRAADQRASRIATPDPILNGGSK
jgi:CRISPR-associated endonuclease/helicase Cas3